MPFEVTGSRRECADVGTPRFRVQYAYAQTNDSAVNTIFTTTFRSGRTSRERAFQLAEPFCDGFVRFGQEEDEHETSRGPRWTVPTPEIVEKRVMCWGAVLHVVVLLNWDSTIVEHTFSWFRRDAGRPHTPRELRRKLSRVLLPESVIWWYPSVGSLSVCGFFLWAFLRSRVYEEKPRNIWRPRFVKKSNKSI